MKIGLVSFCSSFRNEEELNQVLKPFLQEIEKEANVEFVQAKADQKDDFDMMISFVKTGGTENLFKEVYKSMSEPYIILSTDHDNSLAASMEILSFLRQQDMKGEILHGTPKYIASRIIRIANVIRTKNRLAGAKFGVVGKPSDWLISSDVDYGKVREKTGIELVNISIEELKTEIGNRRHYDNEFTEALRKKIFDENELQDALYIFGALKYISEKYDLSALTIRCFDLLGPDVHNTGCIALSVLNGLGIPAGCEGDIPSLISMATLYYLTGQPVFMANPSKIDVQANSIVFAHCTLPINMPESYTLDTHFESGIGVAVKGEIPTGDATVFKASKYFDRYFASSCRIEKNLNQDNLCRTQIQLVLDKDVRYFLNNSIGNHHLIVNGDYTEIIDEFFRYVS